MDNHAADLEAIQRQLVIVEGAGNAKLVEGRHVKEFQANVPSNIRTL